MPRRKMSPEEEAEVLAIRSAEVKVRLDRGRLEALLDAFPEAVPLALTHLASLGYVPPTKAEAAENAGAGLKRGLSGALHKLKRAKTVKDIKAEEPDAQSDQEDAAEKSQEKIPSKYWKVSALSRTLIRDRLIVQGLREPALSKRNLYVLEKNGVSTEAAKDILLKIFVLATNLPYDLPLTGSLRTWRNMTQLVYERSLQYGRRGRDLEIPPDWSVQGVYKLDSSKFDAQRIVVSHNFWHVSVSVQRSSLPAVASDEQLYVDFNWSQDLAEIINVTQKDDQLTRKSFKLWPVFALSQPPSEAEAQELPKQDEKPEEQSIAAGQVTSEVGTETHTPSDLSRLPSAGSFDTSPPWSRGVRVDDSQPPRGQVKLEGAVAEGMEHGTEQPRDDLMHCKTETLDCQEAMEALRQQGLQISDEEKQGSDME